MTTSIVGYVGKVLRSGFVIESLLVGVMLAVGATAQTVPPPDAETQDRLLDSMHGYADKYVSNLPNFFCDQQTRESEADLKPGRWRKGDTVLSKLTFHDGREQRTLETVNGKRVKPGTTSRPLPLNTEGEFGMLLAQVLGKDSTAYFTWNRWETVRGKQLAVFDFAVDKESSLMTLRLSDAASAVVGYEGSVYADPATGAVWRISYAAKDIPPQIQTRQISTEVDYAETAIGTKTYLLPTQASVTLLLWTKQIRNELEFRGYRKFEAESSVTFGGEESAK